MPEGSLVCLLETSTWSPPKFLAWQKGFRLGSGLILRKLGLLLLVCSLLLLVSVAGLLLVVVAGTLFLVVLLLLLFFPVGFSLPGGLLLILLFGLSLTAVGGLVRLRCWCSAPPFGLLLGCLLEVPVEVQRVWEVYDERVQFLSRQDALQLDESFDAGDVSRAWLVWSRAAETALADACQICGGPVLGRGSALFRVVRLGGHKVRKARGNASDVHDAAGVFLYRDSSIAPVLDVRRRFKAVMVVLGAMTQHGASLSRSVEPTAQCGRILVVGPLYLVTIDDLRVVRGINIGDFHRAVADVHHRLSDFIHAVVVHRQDDAIRVWRN